MAGLSSRQHAGPVQDPYTAPLDANERSPLDFCKRETFYIKATGPNCRVREESARRNDNGKLLSMAVLRGCTAAPCPGPAFNVAVTAGFYAQMTGLLAGFAFAAIVVLLTPTQNLDREIIEDRSGQGSDDSQADITRMELKANESGVMLALLAAFFALLTATLTYSVLAGETLPLSQGRAATEELVDGLPFGLAVIMLFHGLTGLMDNGNIDEVAVWLSRVVAVVVAPVLTFYYLINGATDTVSATSRAASTQNNM